MKYLDSNIAKVWDTNFNLYMYCPNNFEKYNMKDNPRIFMENLNNFRFMLSNFM